MVEVLHLRCSTAPPDWLMQWGGRAAGGLAAILILLQHCPIWAAQWGGRAAGGLAAILLLLQLCLIWLRSGPGGRWEAWLHF